MEPTGKIQNVDGMNQAFQDLDQQWAGVDLKAEPTDPNSVSSFLTSAFTELKAVIDGNDEASIDLDEIEDLKKQAERGLYKTQEDVKSAGRKYKRKGEISESDITSILNNYASGYRAYTQLCVDVDSATFVEQWNAANEGNKVNCPQMVTWQNNITSSVNDLFDPQTMSPPSFAAFLNSVKDHGRASVGGVYSYYPKDVQQFGLGAELGVRYLVAEIGSAPFFLGGKVLVNPFISRTADPDHRLMTVEIPFYFPVLETGVQIPTRLDGRWDDVEITAQGGIWPRLEKQIGDNPGDRLYYPEEDFPWDASLGGAVSFGLFSVGGDWLRDTNYKSGARVYFSVNIFEGGQQ